MTPEDFERVRELFLSVRELDPTERSTQLDEACADHPALRSEVEALLARQDSPNGLLDLPSRFVGLRSEIERVLRGADSEPVPERIGRYSILGTLGGGGMGIVYLAEQEHPRRKVALKVVRSAGTSRALLRRFEHEASILGHLDHPGIAHVYEAGVADMETRDGPAVRCPYFAMEYVQGELLSVYVKRRDLGLRGRLGLIASICDAVHHAHQKGVIHRDLKPANILVTENGQTKILDFGVARVTDADLQTVTMQTEVGQLIGTIPYMSPEQFSGVSANVDARSDIYALGVICYELLTGRLPHDVSQVTIPQAARIITDEEPTSLTVVDRTYRGDVDTIVSKALEKDKTRRYQSALELGADIRRHLADEPISARPASAVYQLRKFARRNKALVGGALATFLALLIGIIGISVQAVRITRERDIAQQARQLAEEQRTEAQRQAAIAQAVNEFLNEDLLAAANPAEMGRDVTVREVLDQARNALEGRFPNEPITEVSIRTTLGATYVSLGEFEVAEPLFAEGLRLARDQLGEGDSQTISIARRLGNLYHQQGRFDEAETQVAETLETARRALGMDHPETLLCMSLLGLVYRDVGRFDDAEQLLTEAFERLRRVRGEEDYDTLLAMKFLAGLLHLRDRYEEAESLLQRTVELHRHVLGEEHPETLAVMGNLGELYEHRGKYQQAEHMLTTTLELRREVLGDEHPNTLNSLDKLAILYIKQGRYAEAEPLCVRGLEIRRRLLGDDHPRTINGIKTLGVLCKHQGRYAEAEPLYLEALERAQRVWGEDHSQTLSLMNNLGVLYKGMGRYDEAERFYSRALEGHLRTVGKEHRNTLSTMHNLAILHKMQGRYDRAEVLYTEVLEIKRGLFGEEHPATSNVMNSLGQLHLAQGQYDEAEGWLLKSLDIKRRILGEEHPDTLVTLNNIAVLYRNQGQYEKAESLCLKTLEARRRTLGEEHPDTLVTMQNLARLYTAQGRLAEARSLHQETLNECRRILGDEHRHTLVAIHDLAVLQTTLEEFEEAELLAGEYYERLGRGHAAGHARPRPAIELLVHLYDAWDKPEKAEEYRALLRVDEARSPGDAPTESGSATNRD